MRRRIRIRGRWAHLRGHWTRKKILIASLASLGILAMLATTVAAVLSPLLSPAPPTERPAASTPASRRPAGPPIQPLTVRPVLEVPLKPRPDQCVGPVPPAPPPGDPMTTCDVNREAVFQLGPTGLQLHLVSATTAKLPTSAFHTVQIAMDDPSRAAFARYTGANVGRQLALVRDGVVLAAPTITAMVDGQSLQISGELTAEKAETIARMLREGN